MSDEREAWEDAEDDLYNFLDRTGAHKRAAYFITALIDAKITSRVAANPEIAELRGSIKALQDEIRQLNRRLLELSLNASVQLHKDPA